MATNSFNISYIIKAVDKFSPVIKRVQKSLKGLDKNLANIGTKGIKKLADRTKKVETNFKKVAEQTQKVKAKIQTLPPKIDKVVAKTNKAALSAKKLGVRFKQVGDRVKNIGKSLALRVTAPLLAVAAVSIRNAKIQIEAERKVRTGVELLGKRSAFTTDQLFKMASRLQLVSNFGDEDILGGAINSLLRFEGIATNPKIFTAVTQGVIDIAAKTGKPLRGVADTLGRALQEPLTQLSLLERTVTFSVKEKERIKELAKAGDLVGAQLIIIKNIREQFGGFAKDLSETDVGQLNQGMMALGDSLETVGKSLIKSLVPMAKKLKEVALAFDALAPKTKENIINFGLIAAAVGPALIALGFLLTSIVTISKVLVTFIVLLTRINILLFANPIGLMVAGVLALTLGLTSLLFGWEKVVAIIEKAVDIALVFVGIREKRKTLDIVENQLILEGLKKGEERTGSARGVGAITAGGIGGLGGLNEATRAVLSIQNRMEVTLRDKGNNVESITKTPGVTVAKTKGANFDIAGSGFIA